MVNITQNNSDIHLQHNNFEHHNKRILGKLTNCTVNIYAEKPWIINNLPLKTLVKCEVCETYSIIKGNKIQERLHWHSKHHCDQEFEIFSKLMKSEGKICPICKHEVINIEDRSFESGYWYVSNSCQSRIVVIFHKN